MVSGADANLNGQANWLSPPWTTESPAWQSIEQRLDADDLARRVRAIVSDLDLTELRLSYLGVGKPAIPPDLMLRVVLYQMHTGQSHPCRWAKDCKSSDPVKWLAMGLEPSASYFYAFRKRLEAHLEPWNQQVLGSALAEGWTKGDEMSIDGTFIAALGSRHRLVKSKTLEQRLEVLRQALMADCRAARAQAQPAVAGSGSDPQVATMNPVAATAMDVTANPQTEAPPTAGTSASAARPPYWMATTPAGRRRQLHRYQQAQKRLDEMLAHHARRETHKIKRRRRSAEQVRVCLSEPEATLGRDKFKTFRPLYNLQLASDLDTSLILGHGVHATTSDAGQFIPMVQVLGLTLGPGRKRVLVDGIYATAANLAYGEEHGVTIYAPIGAEPASAPADRRATLATKACQIAKEQFRWDAAEQTYYCPQGHRLIRMGCKAEKREQDQEVLVYRYRCPPQHCQACPLATQCTPAPHKGRTISRSEHEEKVEALRQRMQTPEGKALYKKRGQTVEPRIGDLKAHRGLRCFAGFGIALAAIQVGLLVLIHNALCLMKLRNRAPEPTQRPAPSLEAPSQRSVAVPSAVVGIHALDYHVAFPRPPN